MKEFDAIIIYETNFQKSIVDYLLNEKYQGKDVLLIDSRNHKISSDDFTLHINLGGIRWILKSLIDIRKFPKLYTKELVGTHFTGIHCRFFEAVISYKYLSIIDDGIGTPVLLRKKTFSTRSFTWFSRLLLSDIIMLITYRKRLLSVKEIIKKISKYYTIYRFVDNSYLNNQEKIDIVYLNFIKDLQQSKVVKGKACYISTGVNPYEEQCLNYVVGIHKYVTYYPHPGKTVNDKIKKIVSDVCRLDVPIEHFFMKNGFPEYIYGDMTSAILNMKLGHVNCNMCVFTHLSPQDVYYSIYAENGITLIDINTFNS